MNLTKERQKEKKARDLIFKALQELKESDPIIPEFTENKIPYSKYNEKLTPRCIETGVVVLLLINNMSVGSGGDIDLYRLLNKYLLDKNARTEINKIITKT